MLNPNSQPQKEALTASWMLQAGVVSILGILTTPGCKVGFCGQCFAAKHGLVWSGLTQSWQNRFGERPVEKMSRLS
jgi:hypothetical protein